MLTSPAAATSSWIDACAAPAAGPAQLLAVLPGEGIGPEMVAAALQVLDALEAAGSAPIPRLTGGPIGLAAEPRQGGLTPDCAQFCRDIFRQQGVLFCGPGGGRFVYDLRRRFDLFCKLAPLQPAPVLRPDLAGVDILVVRDNIAGIYQDLGSTYINTDGHQVAQHTLCYTRPQVERLIRVGARLALQRRGDMHVVVKDGGLPAVSALWKETARDVAAQLQVRCAFLNADYAAYLLMQNPRALDILVTSNMVGDILADLGAVLLGSRGLSYSGNFSDSGAAAYQTGHGAAHDLAGTDRANPVGQILSLAMMLRQSFRRSADAALIEQAVAHVWRQGYRTADQAASGPRCLGTRALAARIAQAVGELARPA